MIVDTSVTQRTETSRLLDGVQLRIEINHLSENRESLGVESDKQILHFRTQMLQKGADAFIKRVKMRIMR